MNKALLISIVAITACFLLLNALLKEPAFPTGREEFDFAIKTGDPAQIEKACLRLLENDSLNLSVHYNWIIAHHDQANASSYLYDQNMFNLYHRFRNSGDSAQRDMGNYMLGLWKSLQGEYHSALEYFAEVQNRDLKYLNNSEGFARLMTGRKAGAEQLFRREITLNGNLEGAWSNLLQLLDSESRKEELYVYYKNPEIKKFFPASLKRKVALNHFQFHYWYIYIMQMTWARLTLHGFIAALLITLFWLIYLRKIDIYEPEKWSSILITFLLGAVFSDLTFLLSDLLKNSFGFDLNGGVWNDMSYCVLGIGVTEELSKIIPLWLMLKYSRAINEPVDYIIYGSVSALGFAFAENLLYFQEGNLHIIHGRAITAAVFHMFLTSVAAYGLMLQKCRGKNSLWNRFIFWFILASLAHGFYDFWLINEKARAFSIFSILFLILSIMVFRKLINNGLNQSEFFDETIRIHDQKLLGYLLYGLTGILIYQYLAVANRYSIGIANESLKNSVLSGSYLMILIATRLTGFRLKKGTWLAIDPVSMLSSGKQKEEELDLLLGRNISLQPYSRNQTLREWLPNEGVIIRRDKFSGASNWLFIRIQDEMRDTEYCKNTLLIRPKPKEKALRDGNKIMLGIFLIPDPQKIDSPEKTKNDFHFIGWAVGEIIP